MPTQTDRAITPTEAAVVRWLLDNAAVGDVTIYRERPVEDLRVVSGCDCGCSSLHFEPAGSGHSVMIADAMAVYPDGVQANLILWGRAGRVVWLEVCDIDPRVPQRVPEISNLRTGEDLGRDLLLK